MTPNKIPAAIKELIEMTAPGSADRLVTRYFLEANGCPKVAFQLFEAEHEIEEHLYFVMLMAIVRDIPADQLAALADKPVQLPPELCQCPVPVEPCQTQTLKNQ